MTTTTKELRALHEHMKKMGKIDEDKLFLIVIINALGRHYHQLQSDIHGMTDDPNFNWVAAVRQIETEVALVQQCAEVGAGFTTHAIALTASDKPKVKVQPAIMCSNCK